MKKKWRILSYFSQESFEDWTFGSSVALLLNPQRVFWITLCQRIILLPEACKANLTDPQLVHHTSTKAFTNGIVIKRQREAFGEESIMGLDLKPNDSAKGFLFTTKTYPAPESNYYKWCRRQLVYHFLFPMASCLFKEMQPICCLDTISSHPIIKAGALFPQLVPVCAENYCRLRWQRKVGDVVNYRGNMFGKVLVRSDGGIFVGTDLEICWDGIRDR